MKQRSQPIWIYLALVLIAVVSVFFDLSGVLQTQLLETPQQLESLKLVKQETNPVQFDIYYQALDEAEPANISITFIKALLDKGQQIQARSNIIESLVLATGTQSISTTDNSQTLSITNISPLQTTKLGSIVTNIPLSEYVSLEYDVQIRNQRQTLIETALSASFPLGTTAFQNPTAEPMYIAVPGFHTILAPLEKIYLEYPQVQHGAALLSNTITTFQALDDLNRGNIVSSTISRETPELVVEQGELMLPEIPSRDLNTLIVRYKNSQSNWSYQSFLLTASKDLTLPVEVRDLLDFYDQIEYSFAYLSDALPTVNLEFPYNSLLPPDQYPVFYRTDYTSLVPELVQHENGLQFDLSISTANVPDGLYLGILTREPLSHIKSAVDLFSQKLPVVLFNEASQDFSTRVSNPQKLPYFNLIGKNNQVWNKQVNSQNLEFISSQFTSIELIPDNDQLPELEVINESLGDKLLCFVKTEDGAMSLPTTSEDVLLTGDCLISAFRAGLDEGVIYPVLFDSSEEQLVALKHFSFDRRLSSSFPRVENYNPYENTITLSSGFEDSEVKVLVSPNPQFSSHTTLSLESMGRGTFEIPSLPGCNSYCYIKAITTVKEDANIILGYATRTLVYSPIQEPLLQLCLQNHEQIKNLLPMSELEFNVLQNNQTSEDLTFQTDSKCFEINFADLEEQALSQEESDIEESSDDSADSTDDAQANLLGIQKTHAQGNSLTLESLFANSPDLPSNSILLHTNGYTNSYIEVPPQQFLLNLDLDSEQVLLLTDLVFEHAHLKTQEQALDNPVLQTSYQISQWAQSTTVFGVNRGNIILNSSGQSPYFQERINISAPLNESVLFPSGGRILEVPHTIRVIPPEQIILQGSAEGNNRAEIQLQIPKRSQVQLFLENIFRPNIDQTIQIEDGIQFNEDSGYMTLENPTGAISIPLQLSTNQITDASIYADTDPPTPIPDEINVAYLESAIVLDVQQPADIPESSLLNPVQLSRAEPGFEYQTALDLYGIENSLSFQILETRFLSNLCQDSFSFDVDNRRITGGVPSTTTLESCYFQVDVRYLLRTAIAEMEVTTSLYYLIPITSSQQDVEPELVSIPLVKGSGDINEVINITEPVEELIETTSQFTPKANAAGIISSIGDLIIVFEQANQQFVISGPTDSLQQKTSRYLRALDRKTGNIVLFELQFIPVSQEEIIIPITQSFPNLINVPQILLDEGYSEEEVQTLTIEADTLPTSSQISDEGIVNIYGLPELNDQVFYALIEQQTRTPSPFVEFERRLTQEEGDDQPLTLRIDLRLQVSEAPTVTMPALQFSSNKLVSIDVRNFASPTSTIASPQLPEFLKRQGNQLYGTTPAEAQELSILLQDYTRVQNIVVPIIIGDPQSTEEEPDTNDQDTEPNFEEDLDSANRPAAVSSDDCFPDIADQPLAYREAICLAEEFGVISGSGGLFRPNNNINRAEVSKILVTGPLVLLGLITDEESENLNSSFSGQSFSDVPRVAWFYGFVEAVKEVGIFDGYPDGSFGPSGAINKAEASKAIVNTIMQLQPESFGSRESLSANTVSGDPWFAPFVRILNMNGGDLPDVTNSAELGQSMTRAEFIYNLLILLDSKANTISNSLAN